MRGALPLAAYGPVRTLASPPARPSRHAGYSPSLDMDARGRRVVAMRAARKTLAAKRFLLAGALGFHVRACTALRSPSCLPSFRANRHVAKAAAGVYAQQQPNWSGAILVMSRIRRNSRRAPAKGTGVHGGSGRRDGVWR